ncbi:putative family 31 glucosidase KIAA1161-like protein [Dinothrombium tinctorium]|uniref:Putative family 31 glucosidase KIAA1161-like protein n=1 Tax=Dinothrombium tinctorium TaxID=1965070 RepID=A0A3S3SIW7_9ACAR|nr:putative family 31 glucosidase KIAA1161-like protein [Dinothrombium tinctorium]RWS14195.1 putative family 31 glucosidase KIAA1161-like protein [Dinothrombium tinctorium]RWS14711.1 putative family 31 glucosidase KIAA1161-like protein [Dinothrombium tinctorium]
MLKAVGSESGESLVVGENSHESIELNGERGASASSPVFKRKLSDRRDPKAKVMTLSVDNTWSAAAAKSNTKLKASVGKMSAALRWGKRPEFWFKITVGLLFIVIALLIGTTILLYNRQMYLQAFKDKIYFLEESRQFYLIDAVGNELLKVEFAVNIPADIKSLNCFPDHSETYLRQLCREWQFRANLNIEYHHKPHGISCYAVRWQSYDARGIPLKDCFDLGDGFWYGMGEIYNLSWPLNGSLNYSPFVTGHNLSNSSPFGRIIKRYWLSSKGISIRVPLNIPLFITYNASDNSGNYDGKLCFEARTNEYPYSMMSSALPRLDYTICTGSNITELHTEVAKNWTKSLRSVPKNIPKREKQEGKKRKEPLTVSVFFKEPFWTTATELFSHINQTTLQKYADKIMNYAFEPGLIVVDSRWESHVGDLSINRKAFHNPQALFSVLHYKGFKIILTVTPFIDISADSFVTASIEKRVCVDRYTGATLLVNCEEGTKRLCALLDFMNATTREWFQKRLKDAIPKELDIDGIFFKGIDVRSMPLHQHNSKPHIVNPDYFQLHYKNLAKNTMSLTGLNTAAGINGLESFFQILPLKSSWEALRTVIPTVLTLGLIGYPIVNTGSVGGQISDDPSAFDVDLYIRWLELSAFLPTVQFSEPPGRNNLQIIRVAKKMSKVREEHILPILETCLTEYRKFGWPIIRPMWWLQPDDKDAYLINDQFVVGNEIIVAPILHPNVTERDIYLPSGWWRDELNAQMVRGGKWVRNYQVDIEKVAYFKRTDPNSK